MRNPLHKPAITPIGPSLGLVLGGMALLAALLPAAWVSGLDMPWFTVFPGGVEGAGDRFRVTAVIGQPIASAPMQGHRYSMTGGFLVPMVPDPTPTPTPTPTSTPAPTPTPEDPGFWLAY